MKPDFNKGDGLIPVIIQDNQTLEVLMLGYMNEEAYLKTAKEGLVTFFSRSKNRLWTKGEESGHFLTVNEMYEDCDSDTFLIKVTIQGPICHKGSRNCFVSDYTQNFIFQLENIIQNRKDHPSELSYVAKLFSKGINKISQKVGEEAVETVIAALAETEQDFINESSDLLFHFLVLLKAKNLSLREIADNLKKRERPNLES